MKRGHSEYYMQHYSNETENLLLKYWCQQAGIVIDPVGYHDEEYSKLIDWINDGEPTGIATNDEFYAMQKEIYGNIKQSLYLQPLCRIKYFYFSVNHYKRYDFDKVARQVCDTGKFNQKNVPYECTPRFRINGLCTFEHLKRKDTGASFKELTDGIYGLKTTPDKMHSIICNILPEEQRTAMISTVNAFSGTPEGESAMKEPAFHVIDRGTWKRNEYFEYYFHTLKCRYNIGADLDISRLHEFRREKGLKFFPVMLYVVMRAVNMHPEFRMAFNERKELGYWEEVWLCRAF